MSKIVIAVQSNNATVVAALRSVIPDKSFGEIKQALSTGAPLLARKLFHNDHDEAVAQLKAVIDVIRRLGFEPRLYEIDDDEDDAVLIDSDQLESVEYLQNILDRHDQIKADRARRGG
jgi:hypothetical protein